MIAQEMWKCFSEEQNIAADYEAWSFGDAPDVLADLVQRGIKTATAGLHLWYTLEKEPLPEVGTYSVILDSQEQAVCVIRNTKVSVMPFCKVSEDHAFLEGEGDRSLSYWRAVHEKFFSNELKEINRTFHESMEVVCEEFMKVYP